MGITSLLRKALFWLLLGFYAWLRFSIVHSCLQQWYFSVCENSFFILTIILRQEKTCPVFFFHLAKSWNKMLGQIILWFWTFKIYLWKLVLNLFHSPQVFCAINIVPFFFFWLDWEFFCLVWFGFGWVGWFLIWHFGRMKTQPSERSKILD